MLDPMEFDQIFNALASGVCVVDEDFHVLRMNNTLSALFGLQREQTAGRKCYEILHSSLCDTSSCPITEILGGKERSECEAVRELKDGTRIFYLASAAPLRDLEEELAGIVLCFTDISKRVRIEEQLLQAQKMECVGRLAGGIAHDFNNILTVINGYAELLLFELGTLDPSHEYVTTIRRSGQRATDLVRQLLAFSRKQIIQLRVLDLNEVVLDMDKMLRRIIGEDIGIDISPESDLWPIEADPAQMEQIIVNLAVNGRDAMPQGGRLTIETANVVLDEAYVAQHLGARPGDYVMLAISDTGVGMSEEVKAHLFEPFFTTKELGKGTGLGLATVYGIVKQNQGNIWCYSEEGIGTTFKIYLPRSAEVAESVTCGRDSGPMPRGGETILVAEDDEAVRNLTIRVLEQTGYTVLGSPNPEDALEQARRHPGDVHLVLTDVVMPQMSGRELAERITQTRPGVKVLYMSGYTDDIIVRHDVLDPGIEFIQKPFLPSSLVRRVREALEA